MSLWRYKLPFGLTTLEITTLAGNAGYHEIIRPIRTGIQAAYTGIPAQVETTLKTVCCSGGRSH